MRGVLLGAARAYAKAAGVPLRRVSRRVYGDSNFFEKLARRRCSFTAEKFDEMMAWFADPLNWPAQTIPVGAVADIAAGKEIAA